MCVIHCPVTLILLSIQQTHHLVVINLASKESAKKSGVGQLENGNPVRNSWLS
jgi:hypothetical protein